MDHLHPNLHPLMQEPPARRIKELALSPVIGYPLAKKAMDRLEDLLVHPPTHRMPNLLLVGNTNNGKTVIAGRFLELHPAYSLPDEDFVRVPVVMVQAPPIPDEKRLYNGILDKLATPYKVNDKIDRKQHQVMQLLATVQARMLIIDEIHHVLAGNLTKQRGFLNVIKYLSNELQIPIVAIGTKDAFRAIHTDPQLANRFEPHLLPRWRDGEDYRRLLASFERKLPLRKSSYLESDELSLKILSMSEGAIGEISNLLRQAAIRAIHNGQECITTRLLEQIGWQAPSQRKAVINLMN
ncbi:MAG TPA: TniB family NTP-binding protein [Hymenobacter sp.]|uniref:TniB family NTP-binding protein n=1 Tax=Hymenobacter sp. TaxID=1898978 RepID=UPI002D7EBC5E|nr:TniB family NTP-binding protein [Hymenobacter sp.]HET9504238.1 TniB family NTP-binding protein [Hymenobacter sp.]